MYTDGAMSEPLYTSESKAPGGEKTEDVSTNTMLQTMSAGRPTELDVDHRTEGGVGQNQAEDNTAAREGKKTGGKLKRRKSLTRRDVTEAGRKEAAMEGVIVEKKRALEGGEEVDVLGGKKQKKDVIMEEAEDLGTSEIAGLPVQPCASQ
jgi:hypothetical protein